MNSADARFYTSILFRRLPYLVAIVTVALGVAVTVAYVLPPVYRASAKILVEAPQIPADLARSTVPMQANQQLQVIRQEITTRDDLIRLAGKLDIYGKNKPSDQDVVDDMRSRITFEETDLGSSHGGPGTLVFSVAFTADEPHLAATVVNEVVELMLLKQQQQRTARAVETLQFFNQEVTRLGSDLKRIETEILRFKNENANTLPESRDFRRSQQISQQERLISLEREESDLRARRSNLVESYALTGQIVDANGATPEQQMLLDLNRALAEQLAIFSETSPNIVALRARIASLQDAPRSRPSTETSSASDKRRLSALDSPLSYIDERLRTIGREKAVITQRIVALTTSITATPASETVLYSLERNRTNLQTQYNTAIARRAEALIGEQIERRSDGGRFTLLEPATPPESPVGPKRRLIALGGAVGGVALAVAFMLLLEVLSGTIRRPVELVRMLGHQPLATIPYIATADEMRIRTWRTVMAVFSAAAVPISLILVLYLFMQLSVVFPNTHSWLVALGS
ncbi:Wzz/FepE/Etk N-terminal domain-containing protein [Sinorhizobium numidicum]|uniref:Wzz/FepE/Etk N-terminal domain-containing protein n=1 Tax=Sinorhizobium numidicum TaxID=680248 RepID=A0ABY8CQT5_9HYPH|nr:Wzz/FepE/Etk N-terminal domain-containing protein [Sinorhizobium numidicum]WEX75009.1 Wzz/FepE/Etk N-terminal domain-containing protein [Sinorhizobium numidicum]WEX81003.1 Wzz/FepE/Etk N-terminal domain-containing protein [Sinorhizobium numidicum]